MEKILRFAEKYLIPKSVYKFFQPYYHFGLAFLSALLYGFPSKKMFVIGITGTKGKTTTSNLIAQVLNSAGFKTGMASTVNFRIGEKVWANESKKTMLGRFQLQKLLRDMLKAGCKYAVVETSSEGILQFRHQFIDYDAVVFTNLSPEHIERHGGFENYRNAKVKLFNKVSLKKDSIGVYNLDDENVDYFLEPIVKNKWGYGKLTGDKKIADDFKNILKIENIVLTTTGAKFTLNNVEFEMPLLGEFNVYNAVAAISVAMSQNISIDQIRKALKNIQPVVGRMEKVEIGQNFSAIVDYSYEPNSFENALKTLKLFNPNKIIVVVGPTGGGRDKWRRPVMGEIADKYADVVIVTTDDPYDYNPSLFADEMLNGVLKNSERVLDKNVFKIIDRREAIKKAIELAEEKDVLLFSGKAGDLTMCIANDKKIPWNEKEIVESLIREKLNK